MKTTVYAMLMAFVLAMGAGGYSADVQAKKLGGGKSFGKSFSVAKPKSTTPPSSANAAANSTTKKGGFLGGLGGGVARWFISGWLICIFVGKRRF